MMKTIRLDGAAVEEGKKIRIGFTIKENSYVLVTTFEFKGVFINFVHEAVLHLNNAHTEKECTFCTHAHNHRSPCLALRDEDEVLNHIVEKALSQMEENAKRIISR